MKFHPVLRLPPRFTRHSVTLTGLLSGLTGIAHAASTPFAAPAPAAAMPAATGGLLRVLLALIVVVGAIVVTAWLARRMRTLSGGSAGVTVLAQVSLGARERAVWLRAGGCELLVGVAPGNVRTLHVFGQESSADAPRRGPGGADAGAGDVAMPAVGGVALPGTAPDPQRPSFKALLLRSLGR